MAARIGSRATLPARSGPAITAGALASRRLDQQVGRSHCTRRGAFRAIEPRHADDRSHGQARARRRRRGRRRLRVRDRARRSPRPARPSRSRRGRPRSASSRRCSSAASSTRRSRCAGGGKLAFAKIYPLDAEFDRARGRAGGAARQPALSRPRRLHDRRARGGASPRTAASTSSCTASRTAPRSRSRCSRRRASGYLGALSASAYSMVSLVQPPRADHAARRRVPSLSYMASERVVPGYGGGMSSAKAALESDTRVLAYEAGRAVGPPRQRDLGGARTRRARRARSASSIR